MWRKEPTLQRRPVPHDLIAFRVGPHEWKVSGRVDRVEGRICYFTHRRGMPCEFEWIDKNGVYASLYKIVGENGVLYSRMEELDRQALERLKSNEQD